MCGGTGAVLAVIPGLEGLSPRVRGNPIVLPRVVRVCGSIPACAGEPLRDQELRDMRRVYPRVCGGTRDRR